MGVYTTIIHPKDGRELQIKSGYDQCRRYKMFDEVAQLPDGLYDSYSNFGEDDWVIIKNSLVIAIEPLKTKENLLEKYSVISNSSVWSLNDHDFRKLDLKLIEAMKINSGPFNVLVKLCFQPNATISLLFNIRKSGFIPIELNSVQIENLENNPDVESIKLEEFVK